MNKLWKKTGWLAFWVSWPLLFVYLHKSRRTRVLIIQGENILVVRNWLGSGLWALPGGGLHRGENPADGAVREVLEETGLKFLPKQLKYLGSDNAAKSGLKFDYEQFVVKLPAPLPIKAARYEIVEARWIPVGELTTKNTEAASIATVNRWRAAA